MRNVSGLETVYRDYRNKDVNFYYVYSNVQHPEINNFVAPYNIKEKLMHIAEFKRRSESELPWLADTMKNDLKTEIDAAPNGEYVFDKEGKLLRKRFWSDPNTLRQDLEALVGKVDRITRVEDLPTRFAVEPRKIASGVVKPIKLPGRLMPLVVEPQGTGSKTPFYAKLRAEASRSLVQSATNPAIAGQDHSSDKKSKTKSAKKGKLFLGLALDPLYKVHWNNKMSPIVIQIKTSDGIKLSEHKLTGPQVDVDADIDPRQFLIDVEIEDSAKPLAITVAYAACDDAETFCLPVTQKYLVKFERDRFGGSRPGVFLNRLFADIRQHDKNKDGIITWDEFPPGEASMFIGHIDKNMDNQLDEKEIKEFLQMFNNGRGIEPPKKAAGDQDRD